MAFDLLTFCDKNRTLKLDMGDIELCDVLAYGEGVYKSVSSISGEMCSSSSNNLSKFSLWLFMRRVISS